LEYRPALQAKSVPAQFIERIPAMFARRHSLVGVGLRGKTMVVATSKPLSTYVLEDVEKKVGMAVALVLAPRSEVAAAIDAAYEDRTDMVDEIVEELDDSTMESLASQVGATDDLLDVVNKPPVIRLVNSILFRALKRRASDIHFHPYENKLQIRYRIDGVLYDVFSPARSVQPLLTSRVKVMAGMDIAERRMPQDGRCSVRIGDREVDLRVSIVPTSYGERVVLRLLDKTTGIYELDRLGMDDELRGRIFPLLSMSHGIIFVTGPTGSGKTTTLYAFLNHINSAEKNVMTVEDPIEYQLHGISQIQVATKKGLTFATTLRHVVRQDPDVVMVGEVRDIETARLAIQASLTGHLVFSTLHTNDAPGAVARLLDLGVEPYLVSSSLLAVLAQRLVRRICQRCREPYEADPAVLEQLEISERLPEGATFWRGRGMRGMPEHGLSWPHGHLRAPDGGRRGPRADSAPGQRRNDEGQRGAARNENAADGRGGQGSGRRNDARRGAARHPAGRVLSAGSPAAGARPGGVWGGCRQAGRRCRAGQGRTERCRGGSFLAGLPVRGFDGRRREGERGAGGRESA